MKITLAVILIALAGISSAKAGCPPTIQWQQTLGGSNWDVCFSLIQSSDGGVMVTGESFSDPGGNKTAPNLESGDGWLIRLDPFGHKLGDQTFGNNGTERLNVVQQTSDGGFILGATSTSPPGGTKTSPNYAQEDFWLIRLDAAGNKLWDHSYGANDYESLESLVQTSDGGFLLGGTSRSSPGGTRTATRFGGNDYWLVRVDANGTELWQTSFGGTDDDYLTSVIPVSSGGFLIGGFSSSEPNGNKTAAHLGFGFDYWIVRIDASGNRLWDRTYGGAGTDLLRGMQETADGGFVLAGTSSSEQGSGKTSPRLGTGNDFWIVRINSNGEQLWDRAYGGAVSSELYDIQKTADGGFLLGGGSIAGLGGNKTSYGPGDWDYWLVRIDGRGNKLWDQAFGGPGLDILLRMSPTQEGGFVLGGYSYSGTGGDKTAPNIGSFPDIWVVKLSPENFDCDRDGVPDGMDACLETPPGTLVDAHGCSIGQLTPCQGHWRNHGEYVNAVKSAAGSFLKAGLIDLAQYNHLVKEAAQSSCGK